MAKYTIQHRCGHEEEVKLFGKEKERQWKIGKMEEEDCLECQNKQAAEENAEEGLPALEGSDKQVAWAETIRARFLRRIEEYKKTFIEEQKELSEVDERRGPTQRDCVHWRGRIWETPEGKIRRKSPKSYLGHSPDFHQDTG